jgi:hypothetical protein
MSFMVGVERGQDLAKRNTTPLNTSVKRVIQPSLGPKKKRATGENKKRMAGRAVWPVTRKA